MVPGGDHRPAGRDAGERASKRTSPVVGAVTAVTRSGRRRSNPPDERPRVGWVTRRNAACRVAPLEQRKSKLRTAGRVPCRSFNEFSPLCARLTAGLLPLHRRGDGSCCGGRSRCRRPADSGAASPRAAGAHRPPRSTPGVWRRGDAVRRRQTIPPPRPVAQPTADPVGCRIGSRRSRGAGAKSLNSMAVRSGTDAALRPGERAVADAPPAVPPREALRISVERAGAPGRRPLCRRRACAGAHTRTRA